MTRSQMSFTAPEGRLLKGWPENGHPYQFCGDLAVRFVLYQHCSLWPSAEALTEYKRFHEYNVDIGQIQQMNHHKTGKAGLFQMKQMKQPSGEVKEISDRVMTHTTVWTMDLACIFHHDLVSRSFAEAVREKNKNKI